MNRPLLALTVLRRSCRVSQKAIADAVGCFQSDVSQWENGGRPLSEERAWIVLQLLRSKNRKATRGIRTEDLCHPWDEVLIARTSLAARRT